MSATSLQRRQGSEIRFLVVIPILLIGAYLYPYIPGHDAPWCALKIGTGIDCPGCGLVRSVSALLHGNVIDSLKFHVLGFVIVVFFLYVWISAFLKRPLNVGRVKTFSLLFVLALFLQWIARIRI